VGAGGAGALPNVTVPVSAPPSVTANVNATAPDPDGNATLSTAPLHAPSIAHATCACSLAASALASGAFELAFEHAASARHASAPSSLSFMSRNLASGLWAWAIRFARTRVDSWS